jgi:hypothetical protein
VRATPRRRENAKARDLEFGAEAPARLSAATDALKRALGANADAWQADSRIR